MLLQQIAKELGAELVEEQYGHVLQHHQYQLSIKGTDKYGTSKFKPEEHTRLTISVKSRLTALGVQEFTTGSITAAANRPADKLAKDIERRIIPTAKEFEIEFAKKNEAQAMAKGAWEQLIQHMKANDPADYVDEGRDRVRFSFQVKGSWRYFTVDLDRNYQRYTVEVDSPVLTPFAQLADKGDDQYRILDLKGHICYRLEYRGLPNTQYVYTLFDMFLEVFGFKKVNAA